MMSSLRHLLFVLIVCALPRVAAAQVSPDKQAVILARALAYDDNLRNRAGDSLVVAVVFKPGQPGSEAAADAMLRAFKAIEGVKVRELPMRTLKLPYGGKDPLHGTISSQGVDALYLCAGLEADQAAIKDVSHRDHVLTIASREESLESGFSLGVFMVDGKTTITINLPASKEEGAAFSSELLRLARVIR
jgi:hypothetical protein